MHRKSDFLHSAEESIFRAMRESSLDGEHDEGGGGHGTEMGWLVSYADMMTLLFGLFVILFTLATIQPKNMDEVLKQVAKKYFMHDGDNPTLSGEKSTEVSTPAPTHPEQVNTPKGELEAAKEKLSLDERQIADLEGVIQSLGQEQGEVEAKAANMHDILGKMRQRFKSVEGLRQENADLKKDLAAQMAENQKLQDEQEKAKSQPAVQNYMMVLLTWKTEKHDLDLEITTPHQRTFNFKQRKVDGEPGQFELDSRYGPGIEMWKAESFEPGTYRAKASLYSKNGNAAKAIATLTVVTNHLTYKTNDIELKHTGNAYEFKFNVDTKGVVTFEK